MLKVKGFDIYFKHKPDDWGYTTKVVDGKTILNNYRGISECHIEKEGELSVVGIGYCSVVDKFDKSAGRKNSLRRALKGFDREFRTAVWEAYIEEVSHL